MPHWDDAWDHWYDDLGVSTGKLQRQVKCKFCPLTIAYRADKMLVHLGYRNPQGGIYDVSICKMVLCPTKQLFENCRATMSTLPTATLESVNDVHTKEEMEELDPVLSQCGITVGIAHREPLQSSQSTIPSLQEVEETPMQELCQRPLLEGFNASTKEIIDKVWALDFYEANILFNVVRHPMFIHAVCETAHLQMPAYRPPSFNAVRSRLLTAKRIDVEKKVEEKLGNSIGKYGVTICCDGWDNVQNQPLLNVVKCGPNGDLFLAQSTPSATIRTTNMSQVKFCLFLEKVGVHNVVKSARTMHRL